MGNTPSSAKPEKASQPASPANNAHHHHHHHHDARREPRRRESIPALTHKTSAASPSLDTTSASGHAIFPSNYTPAGARQIQHGHSRNRSNTTNQPKADSTDVPRRHQSLKSPSPHGEQRVSPASRPVDVPQSARPPQPDSPVAVQEAYHLPPNSYSRPPRLPLPIEQETHTPGSPIISPASPADGPESDDIPRRSSVVSSTVDDDDEEPDNFEGYSTNAQGPKVPTIIEWLNASPNDRVYVTGTFTNWERKFRLHKDGPSKHKNALSATLHLPPGTHHIKFIANGDMLTSDNLPTTVDYTNILVNYVEVSLDQLSQPNMPVPAQPPAPSRPMDIRPKPPTGERDPIDNQVRNTPPTPSHDKRGASPPAAPTADKPRQPSTPSQNLVRQPSKEYTSTIPAYLSDLDAWYPPAKEDHSSANQAARFRFERANAAAESQPPPPSLPMFLSKSILNGTTPTKDDSSVLIMPNHTVLNHLATTNIKQGVLATSATTRYKRKFLTTIMYKPRSDDGD